MLPQQMRMSHRPHKSGNASLGLCVLCMVGMGGFHYVPGLSSPPPPPIYMFALWFCHQLFWSLLGQFLLGCFPVIVCPFVGFLSVEFNIVFKTCIFGVHGDTGPV